jgi:hypothetical protein
LPVEYLESFVADPKWITDQPANFHRVKERKVFSARCENEAPGYTPNRYAYKQVSYDGKSFVIEFTLNMLRLDPSAGVAFGIFDENLACGKPNSICLDISRSEKGTAFTLAVGAGKIVERADSRTGVETGKAYACRIVYDHERAMAGFEVWDIQADKKVADAIVKNVKDLPQSMCFLGFTAHPTGWTGAVKGAAAVAEVQRIELRCGKGTAVVKPVLPAASPAEKPAPAPPAPTKIVPQPAIGKKASPVVGAPAAGEKKTNP